MRGYKEEVEEPSEDGRSLAVQYDKQDLTENHPHSSAQKKTWTVRKRNSVSGLVVDEALLY